MYIHKIRTYHNITYIHIHTYALHNITYVCTYHKLLKALMLTEKIHDLS